MTPPQRRFPQPGRTGHALHRLLAASCLLSLLPTLAFTADRQGLFAVPDSAPPAPVESNRVIVTEVTFDGPPFNGAPTRIFGFYARPEAPGKYPGVVQLHGAGLVTLTPNLAVLYAQHGYACFSLDWAGPGERRVGPTSLFNSVATTAIPPRLPDGSVERGKPWIIPRPEQSGITNGVRFVLAGFHFLRNRPEVDPDRLCLSGMSAGAYLSLLVLGQDPTIKAAAVKYGCGYIRDFPGYFGGYFSPLVLGPKADQDVWLEALDPQWYLPDYRASVLMLSGTNDRFFLMPLVLETWRHIPSPKRLVMLPNDNHSQVGNEEFPLRYFNSVFGAAPAFPEATNPTVKPDGANLVLTSQVTGPSKLTKVDFCVMCMPRDKFAPNHADTKWTLYPATQAGDDWTATVPGPPPGEQLIAYLHAEDETGAKVSSDTVEVPEFPKWRGLPEPPPAPTTP
ncbi:MAG: prolyl oligopeptidase family serine peptidase [candidate division WS1 bacterium]|nr:prolyl oligopeptidase family serine peptidase [candidate division WS1 bacterium]